MKNPHQPSEASPGCASSEKSIETRETSTTPISDTDSRLASSGDEATGQEQDTGLTEGWFEQVLPPIAFALLLDEWRRSTSQSGGALSRLPREKADVDGSVWSVGTRDHGEGRILALTHEKSFFKVCEARNKLRRIELAYAAPYSELECIKVVLRQPPNTVGLEPERVKALKARHRELTRRLEKMTLEIRALRREVEAPCSVTHTFPLDLSQWKVKLCL